MTAHIDELVTPIFTPEMGKRLMVARQYRDMDQRVLAPLLGLNQATLSRMETGGLAVARHPFTLATLKRALGDPAVFFILRGTNDTKFYRSATYLGFWEKRGKRKGRRHRMSFQEQVAMDEIELEGSHDPND